MLRPLTVHSDNEDYDLDITDPDFSKDIPEMPEYIPTGDESDVDYHDDFELQPCNNKRRLFDNDSV